MSTTRLAVVTLLMFAAACSPPATTDGGVGGSSGGSAGGGGAGGGGGGGAVTAGGSGGDTQDAAVSDSGVSDSGVSDSGVSDSGVSDAGVSDSGVSDSGASDAGVSDAGVSDSGVSDAGVSDAGVTDAGYDAGTPPLCATQPALDVKSATFTLALNASGTSTLRLPLGFLVSGTVKLQQGTLTGASAFSGSVRLTNRFTGDVYDTLVQPQAASAGDLAATYAVTVPAGRYDVTSRFNLVFGSTRTLLQVVRAEPAPFELCPAQATGATTLNLTHPPVPTLTPRTVQVSGLATPYGTLADDESSRAFTGQLVLESTDGRLTFSKIDDGYVSSTHDGVTFNAWPLPNVTGGFVVRPTLRAELLTFNTNGWVHAYRFAAPATIAFTATAGSSAFSPLAIPSGDIVRISGTPSDPNQRLFKVWVGFSASQTEWAYVEHFAGCSAPDAVGDLYTPQPSYDFPVRAAQACSFSGAPEHSRSTPQQRREPDQRPRQLLQPEPQRRLHAADPQTVADAARQHHPEPHGAESDRRPGEDLHRSDRRRRRAPGLHRHRRDRVAHHLSDLRRRRLGHHRLDGAGPAEHPRRHLSGARHGAVSARALSAPRQ
ncbi:MAG: hypothetical protein IPJ65_03875 [Archangiaceae bacterium]|nr:hypothetical protein [Archangiaceae bacterium]